MASVAELRSALETSPGKGRLPSASAMMARLVIDPDSPVSPVDSILSSQESTATPTYGDTDQSPARSIMGLHSTPGPQFDLPSPSIPKYGRCNPRRQYTGRGSGYGDQFTKGRGTYRKLWQQVTKIGSGQSLGELGFPEATVEHLVSVVQKLPQHAPVVPAVVHGLYAMDSRAVAALLKEVAKCGLSARAIELFDWLRSQPPNHDLSHLCDVYTYTTVIALCGQRQSLRMALELVAEMRGRGVPCNVHTYSALMNTCIKCGELELALDVFHQLQVEGCVANVVTFNTLVDVYGKLGRWQDAIRVLDLLYHQGLEPETRTFNTVIIAANMCNQPLEALAVYDRMVACGYAPTATTYTALISAYGKAGQLDKALQVYDQMMKQDCERNIITYGSLIAACDKAGRWELALHLLDKMRADHVSPNTLTFNSLLSSCAQGGQSERAESLFQSMVARRCKPDSATYSALVSAHMRAGHWRAAIQAMEAMQAAGNRPDSALCENLIDALWQTGIAPAQAHAARLFTTATRSGLIAHPLTLTVSEQRDMEVTFSTTSASLVVLALHKWLLEMQERASLAVDANLGNQSVTLMTGMSGVPGGTLEAVPEAVLTMLDGLHAPFRAGADGKPQRLVAESWQLTVWLQRDDLYAALLQYIPEWTQDAMRVCREGLASGRAAAQEAAINDRLAEAHQAFSQAEAQQEASAVAAEPLYLGARDDCLELAVELTQRLKLPLESVHRAMVLLDNCMTAGMSFSTDDAHLLVACCLDIAARQISGSSLALSSSTDSLAVAIGHPTSSLLSMIETIRAAGITDVLYVSPSSALSRFFAHLSGDSHSRPDGSLPPPLRAHARLAGNARQLLLAATLNPAAAKLLPSLLAAAAIAVDRRSRGWVPVWPVALARWTGLPGPGDVTFDVAMQLVTKA